MPSDLTAIQPWGTVYGTGLFTAPGQAFITGPREYVIMAADGAVYACLENNFPRSVPLPAGVTITGTVRFTQAAATLFMWRGALLDPLQLTDLSVGFQTVPDPPTGLGLQRIGKGIRAVLAGDRLWVQTATGIEASDVLEFTRFRLSHSYAVNSSPGDELKTIIVFGSGINASIIALKRRSIHRLVNVVGDLTDLLIVTVTNRFGIVAEESVVDVGADLFWFTDEGVASLTLTDQGEVQPSVRTGREPQPMLSDPIQPLIERIKWTSAAGAWGAFWNGNYYLAVPLDDAESFREELIEDQLAYLGMFGPYSFSVPNRLVVGARYRYVRADSGTTDVSDGTTTLSRDGEFVAASTTLSGTRIEGSTGVLDSVRRVFKGVNTAILVYSTRNAAWAGFDSLTDGAQQSAATGGEGVTGGLEVKSFFIAKAQSRLRLFFVSQDGWVNMYEEDFEDWLSVPYVDVSVDALPALGDTIRVNGGAQITVISGGSNTATEWARGATLAQARANFYTIGSGPSPGFSYNQQNVTPWSAPDTTPSVVSTVAAGVFRFYSTNGLVPTVEITGTWATVTRKTTHGIPLTLVTRAYRLSNGVMQGRSLNLAAQLQTWNPKYTLTSRPEGVQEDIAVVTDRTRSRVKYDRPYNKADWVQTNVNDDFLTRWRQDYSVVFTSDTMELTKGSGIKLDQHQEATHRVPSRGRARRMQLKLTNSEGRVRLLAVENEAIEEGRGMGTKT